MAGEIRLDEFPTNNSPLSTDLLYSANSLTGYSEQQVTIAGVASAMGTITAFGTPTNGDLVKWHSSTTLTNASAGTDYYSAGNPTTLFENDPSSLLYVGNTAGSIDTAVTFSTAMGVDTLNSISGALSIGDTAYGSKALTSLTTNSSYNSAFGYNTLSLLSSGSNNNTAIGYNSGSSQTSYTQCTFLGSGADTNTGSLSNTTAIGYGAIATQSNQIMLGNSSITSVVPGASAALGTSGNPWDSATIGTSGSSAINIATGTSSATVNLATGSGGSTLNLGFGSGFTVDPSGNVGISTGVGVSILGIQSQSANYIQIGQDSTTTITELAGTINIGIRNTPNTINIGTAAARTIGIGFVGATTVTSSTLNLSAGSLNIATCNNGNINIQTTGGGTYSVNIGTSNTTTSLIGTANINTTGSAATNIGTTSYSGTISIGNASSTTSLLGIANINTSGSAATNIGIGSYSGTISIGNYVGPSTFFTNGLMTGNVYSNATTNHNVGLGQGCFVNLTSGTYATALGISSLINLTSGNYNTACGYNGLSGVTTGSHNLGVGFQAGQTLTTGSNCVIIGSDSDVSSTSSSNRIALGQGITVSNDNQAVIGNTSITSIINASTSAGCKLGTAANPFGGLVLGNAATNVYTISPATASAARTYTIPDVGQDASFVLNAITVVSGTSATLVANTSTISNNASLVTLTLPTTCLVGDFFQIIGQGAGGWTLAQNSGQLVHYNSSTTTTGTGGSLSSTNQYNCLKIVCIVANTTFVVVNSVGTLTIV